MTRTRVVTATGGSVTVAWTPDSIRLVSVSPAPGWSEEERSVDATEVSVRFRRDGGGSGEGSDSSKAEASVEDGTLRVEVD